MQCSSCTPGPFPHCSASGVVALQGDSLPVVAHGLLQHETKLSVLNFTVKKDSNFTETLPNKTELLFVTGLR